jgi:hypothetical protein
MGISRKFARFKIREWSIMRTIQSMSHSRLSELFAGRSSDSKGEATMFLLTWSKEKLESGIELLIRASELLEQRALEIEARHDSAHIRAVDDMRQLARLAARDAYDLQEINKEPERHVVRATCAECRLPLSVIAQDGVSLTIAPHACERAN